MSHDEVLARVKYAADQGATQIMIQGGVNPDLPLTWYEELFARVRVEYPNVDIHSLSVSEITGLAKVENMTPRAVLERLKAAGMKSLPGAGAEILVERVRKRISARKVTPNEWLGVMRRSAASGYADDRDDDVRLDRDRRRAHRTHARPARAARRDRRLYRIHSLVLRAVQDAAAREGSDGAGVLARTGGVAAVHG